MRKGVDEIANVRVWDATDSQKRPVQIVKNPTANIDSATGKPVYGVAINKDGTTANITNPEYIVYFDREAPKFKRDTDA